VGVKQARATDCDYQSSPAAELGNKQKTKKNEKKATFETEDDATYETQIQRRQVRAL
jgi:hypothetical protein